MKNGLLDWPTILQVFHHDPFEEFRGDAVVPDAFRINHEDRSIPADAKAGSLSALHARRPEEQSFPLQQARQLGKERAPASIR